MDELEQRVALVLGGSGDAGARRLMVELVREEQRRERHETIMGLVELLERPSVALRIGDLVALLKITAGVPR